MAKQMPYDDAYGNHYDESYWRLVQVNLGIADRTATALFYGYKDAASRLANKQSIGAKQYAVSGSAFDAIMVQYLTPGGPNVMQISYQIATTTKDVVVDPNDPTKNVSFFDEATDLL